MLLVRKLPISLAVFTIYFLYFIKCEFTVTRKINGDIFYSTNCSKYNADLVNGGLKCRCRNFETFIFFNKYWVCAVKTKDASVYLENHANVYFTNKTSKEITGQLAYINTNLRVNKYSLCYDVWRVLILDSDGVWTRINDHDLLLYSLVPFRLFLGTTIEGFSYGNVYKILIKCSNTTEDKATYTLLTKVEGLTTYLVPTDLPPLPPDTTRGFPPTTTIYPYDTTQNPPDDGLSTTTIYGIAIGAVVACALLLLLLIVLLCLYFRRKNNSKIPMEKYNTFERQLNDYKSGPSLKKEAAESNGNGIYSQYLNPSELGPRDINPSPSLTPRPRSPRPLVGPLSVKAETKRDPIPDESDYTELNNKPSESDYSDSYLEFNPNKDELYEELAMGTSPENNYVVPIQN